MKPIRALAWSLVLILSACQPRTSTTLTLIDNGQTRTIPANERVPLLILTQAGLTVNPNDRILLNGTHVPLDAPLPPSAFEENGGRWRGVLQLRRAVTLTLVTPQGQQLLQSSAPTVGQALAEAGIQLYASDLLDPSAGTYINGPLTINYVPGRELLITVGDQPIAIRSSAGTVGEALADAGIPLLGLDYSAPSENEAIPTDGQIRVVQVTESILVASESIPYPIEYVESPEVELGQQEVLEPGREGLTITRTRIRYEDGEEVSRVVEDETMVSGPLPRVLKTGVRPVVNTIDVNGEKIEYWHAYEMYATIYSPCNSGTGGCSYSTASGQRAGRGVVAVDPSMYSYLQGQRVYIPGYGFAVIGDVGGGYIIEDLLGISRYRWIDLGFDDNNIVDMSGWLTVYFLAPAPATIPPAMQ